VCAIRRQVAFVYMPKDEAWASAANVKHAASTLQAAGHPTLVRTTSYDAIKRSYAKRPLTDCPWSC
jgi:hypothetical protein